MLKIVICEDNSSYREMLSVMINTVLFSKKVNGKIVLETNDPSTVVDFVEKNHANVFFLDIDLNTSLTGLDLANKIRNDFEDPYIVFISKHTDMVFKSFKVKAYDFLPKPASINDIDEILSNIYNEISKKLLKEGQNIFPIKIGSKIYNVLKDEIIYIEKYSNKSIFHTTSSTVYCYDTLDSLIDKLGDSNFIRCHRSYIVNKNHVKQISGKTHEVLLTNNYKCFVGGKYKDSLMN